MSVPTLIMPPRYTADSVALWQAALSLGWRVTRLPGWRVESDFVVDEPVLYGEPLFVATVANQLRYTPLEPPFDFLAHLPHQYRLRQVRFGRGADIAAFAFPGFLKPADDKCFPASIYQSRSELVRYAIPGNAPVLWSEPVDWDIEFRCFAAGRHCLTLSPYARHGALAQAPDGSWTCETDEARAAQSFVTDLLSANEVAMPPALVLDVGLITGKGWAVVEANPCWGAGIYGCDPLAVLKVLRAAFVREADVAADDSRWVNRRDLGQ